MPLLFWSGLRGAGVSLSPGRRSAETDSELVGRSRRCWSAQRTLDDCGSKGRIHEALIAFDGLPRLFGGSPRAAARADFEKAP